MNFGSSITCPAVAPWAASSSKPWCIWRPKPVANAAPIERQQSLRSRNLVDGDIPVVPVLYPEAFRSALQEISHNSQMEQLTLECDPPPSVWDHCLAELRGHPLQSTLWGNARAAVDRIEQRRWMALHQGQPVFMARYETRVIPVFGRIAWIPKGPTTNRSDAAVTAYGEFLDHLRKEGFRLCIDDTYPGDCEAFAPRIPLLPNARTIWIELTVGRDRLWNALDSQTRSRVRNAARAGVVVEQSRDPGDVLEFFGLCEQISKAKKFALPGSEPLLRVLCTALPSADAEARLFVARSAGELVAGAMTLRCGRSLHYFWGAVDRRFSKQRPGEAVQWRIIEWAVENGLDSYDLEGIDPENNPGTYQFKMKMGGKEVSLPGKHAYPLSILGWIALKAGQWLGKI